MDFAPRDAIEDAIVKRLRATYTRVSAERICAGPGIVPIYETLAAIEHKAVEKHDDKTLWNMALEGKDDLAVAALDRFRSEEHTSELQSLMRISYAVFCLKKKIIKCTCTSHLSHSSSINMY